MRKTVSELTRIREDVSLTREKLQVYSEELESITYELTTLNLDDIRTDEHGIHTEVLKTCRSYTTKINKAIREHTEAVEKYREFFAC